MHLDWKVWLYVRPPNLKSNISNVLEHHIWNVSKYLKYLGSLIWRCLVKKCFNIKHFKDINFFQSFASIGRIDLVCNSLWENIKYNLELFKLIFFLSSVGKFLQMKCNFYSIYNNCKHFQLHIISFYELGQN